MSRRLAAWLLALLNLGPAWAGAAETGILTLADGDVAVIRESRRFVAAEGVRLLADDLVQTGASTRVARIEYADGSVLDLGPDSAAWIAPRSMSGSARPTSAYLMRGWARWASAGAQGGGIASPRIELLRLAGVAVLRAEAGADALFVEAGRADVRGESAGAAQTLTEGDAWRVIDGRGQRLARVPAEWAGAMPRALGDTLPRRAARWQSQSVAPAAAREPSYEEVAAWINAEAELRPVFLARFGPLVRDRSFRAAAVAELRLHPEWKNLLFPPPPPKPRPVVAALPGRPTVIHAVGQRAEAALQDNPPEIAP